MDTINRFRDEYFFLSNFYPVPVEYEGITYANNEAAFKPKNVPIKRIVCVLLHFPPVMPKD